MAAAGRRGLLALLLALVLPTTALWTATRTAKTSAPKEEAEEEFRIDMFMPGVTTKERDSYLCMAVKVPRKGNVIRYEPRAQMDTVHHMLLHGCKLPYKAESGAWPCVMGQICARNGGSVQFLYGWGRNAPALHLPQGVGFSIGEHENPDDPENSPSVDGVDWLVLQVHYLDIATEPNDSGVSIVATTAPRPLKAGVLAFATGGSIPPHKEEYHVLSDACYDDARTVQVFAFRVHAHSLGVTNTLSRVSVAEAEGRSNYETAVHKVRKEPNLLVGRSPQLPQSFEPLGGELGEKFLLTPGTRLRMVCTYNSTSRNEITYFGFSSKHEMCNVYLMVMATEAVSHGNFDFTIGAPLPPLRPSGTPVAAWASGLVGGDVGIPDDLGQVSAVAVGWDAHVFVLVRRGVAWGSFGVRQGSTTVGDEPKMLGAQLVHGASLFSFRAPTSARAQPASDPRDGARHGLLEDALYMPHGLSVTPDGHHFWVTDVAQHVAMKLTRDGTVEATVGMPGERGKGASGLCRPTHAVGASDGSVYIADGYCNCRIAHFGADGALLAEWPPPERRGGCQLRVPHGIALDECASLLAVADRENGRVVWLNLMGDAFGDELAGELAFRTAAATEAGIPEELQGYPYAVRRVGGGDIFVLTWARDGRPDGGVAVHRVSPPKEWGADRRRRINRAMVIGDDGSPSRALVKGSWPLPGVDFPHDLAVAASHDGGAIVYVAETRPGGSRLRRFELSAGSPDAAAEAALARADVSLEQDRSALARRRREDFGRISHGVG